MAMVEIKIKCPKVPNFVQTEDGRTVPISSLSDECLRHLAAEWLEGIRKRAAEQNAQKNKLLKLTIRCRQILSQWDGER